MWAEQMQPANANVPWERALPVLSGSATRQQIISVALQQGEGDPHLTARAVSLGGVTKQHPLPRADGSSSAEKLQQLCWAKPGGPEPRGFKPAIVWPHGRGEGRAAL